MKFLTSFREPIFEIEVLSTRKQRVIKYCDKEYEKAEVLIGITHKNQVEYLTRAINSAIKQSLIIEKNARILLLDDNSSDHVSEALMELANHPAITLMTSECGSPARARNLILDWADKEPYIRWVARLDADDELHNTQSVQALFDSAKRRNAIAAIGSNNLRSGETLLEKTNVATSEELLCEESLINFIASFCIGDSSRELPSCNLLLSTTLGLRYPNVRSAEDHWLTLRLLQLYPNKIACVEAPTYSIYSLNGQDTQENKRNDDWQEQRNRLFFYAKTWLTIKKRGHKLLGGGMEGIVWISSSTIYKQFHPWSLNDKDVNRLRELMENKDAPLPKISWSYNQNHWLYTTPDISFIAVSKYISEEKISNFLAEMYRAGIAALNVKRDNLIITGKGSLQYIDIGNDIQMLTTTRFLDMSARLYSIGILGNDDEELVRRKTLRKPEEALSELQGFTNFYRNLISNLHSDVQQTVTLPPSNSCSDITLLIKSCAQDSASLYQQVTHIVTQLNYPTEFSNIVLLIDSYAGPFLRQYSLPDLASVIKQAELLKNKAVIDEYWITPEPKDLTWVEYTKATYYKWFGKKSISKSHSYSNAPLFPHLWAFDKLSTRYVLQCDCDVLIGRKNWEHDYINDMMTAIKKDDVECVGFNIPKLTNSFLLYHGASGEFPPEVRFGLLDLKKIMASLPIINPIKEAHFSLTWHRALQQHQKIHGNRSVRGGHPDSFYIHPLNLDKGRTDFSKIRDLVSQGIVPTAQKEQFDLVPEARWEYASRNEEVVFLLKGKNTPLKLLNRCLGSLQRQTDQNFGIILIDDGGALEHTWQYPIALGNLQPRTTLIRHLDSIGRIPNFILAIEQICINPETFIVVLDQDDCLLQNTIVSALRKARSEGADLIQMPLFRPNKPLKLYIPDYTAPRSKGAANVWTHMRAFKKKLFEKVPKSYFIHKNQWFDSVTDYATMLPMAELAEKPVYLDSGYAYLHERKSYKASIKEHQNKLICSLLTKPSLQKKSLVEPRQADAVSDA
jgi:glycosyltransferase involved in cell wall biosynthesis